MRDRKLAHLIFCPTSFRSSGRNGDQSPVVYVDARDNNTTFLRHNKLVSAWRRLLKKTPCRHARRCSGRSAPGANSTPQMISGILPTDHFTGMLYQLLRWAYPRRVEF